MKKGIHKNLKGQKWNMLTAVKYSSSDSNGSAYWLFRCDCGIYSVKRSSAVTSGGTKSCGCRQGSYSHGFSSRKSGKRNPFYSRWMAIKGRVLDKKNVGYKNYGGRGIKIAKSWLNFQNFYRDMYPSFLKHVEKHGLRNTTIERIDVNKSYTKKNCTWATRLEQGRNKRKKL